MCNSICTALDWQSLTCVTLLLSLSDHENRYITFNITFLICLHGQVYAIRVPGLYEAEVFVQDQSVQVRQLALESAMNMVLVKLTGDRNAAARMELRPVIDNAQDYLLQYRYLEPIRIAFSPGWTIN